MKTGYIYKLCILSGEIDDCYIGSTMNIRKRKHAHKSICNNENSKDYNLYVYRFIREHYGFDNWCMNVLEKVEFDDKIELRKRERYHIETIGASLNKRIPSRTIKEYNIDNKERITARDKKYRINHQEKIKEYKQEHNQINKEKISAQRKWYRANNQEKIKEYTKEHYQINKEKILAQCIKYHQINKEKINDRKSTKIACDHCGLIGTKGHMAAHKRTKLCINFNK